MEPYEVVRVPSTACKNILRPEVFFTLYVRLFARVVSVVEVTLNTRGELENVLDVLSS